MFGFPSQRKAADRAILEETDKVSPLIQELICPKMSTPEETPQVRALICSLHSVWCEESKLILWTILGNVFCGGGGVKYVYAAKCYRIHMQVI